MKCIILGLGTFGAALGEKLTALGHEVIGVDQHMPKVEAFKEKFSHTICLDTTEHEAVKSLPLKDTDLVIVCIGENEGSNIMTTALMRQMKVKRLISRADNFLHRTVLEAMGVDEIVHPEEETAERWAKKLNIEGVTDSYELSKNYSIVEVEVPKAFVGKTLAELELTSNYNVLVLTTIRRKEVKNIMGASKQEKEVQPVASSDTELEKGEVLVLYGSNKDIKRLLKEHENNG